MGKIRSNDFIRRRSVFSSGSDLVGQMPQQQRKVVAAYLSADFVVPIMRPWLQLRAFPKRFTRCLPAEPECGNGVPLQASPRIFFA
ncbi:hypothetical protein FHX14_003524 [Rhizobium sp. BK619]|uniref:hypothetical protein n=1 Tax=Rhizobium sp. BK619 TaxID=2586989 RepID=UPI001620F83D|nr:hypothetical protein [Rhizobium sp. BK619]MBB3647320.1 hypothetical protein [Rhizobium sp. BK619]